MALYDPERDGEYPAPNIPPVTGGGGAPAPGGTGTTDPVVSGGGGGGYAGYGGPVRPAFGGVNIPGAPAFKFNPFVSPDRAALLADPGYQMRLEAGSAALDRSAAARGTLRGGAQVQAQQEYGQNFGSQEYGQAYNRGLQQYDRYYQGAKDAYAPQFARWQQQADANKQGGLMGYQADLNHWQQASAPHYEPAFDPSVLFNDGPDEAPDRARYQSAGYGPSDDDWRRNPYA